MEESRILKRRFAFAFILSGALFLWGCGGGSSQGSSNPPPPATPYLTESDYASVLGTEYNGLTAEWEMKFTATHTRPNTDPAPYDSSAGDALTGLRSRIPLRFAGTRWCGTATILRG